MLTGAETLEGSGSEKKRGEVPMSVRPRFSFLALVIETVSVRRTGAEAGTVRV